jgi:hypothetical protein
MKRSRVIKPGFFENEMLAEVEPLGRLLFAGLWTIADREGRLEDRPKKLKGLLLCFDDCDVDALLNQLQRYGFVTRYAVNGGRYLEICNFLKHQHPHPKEAPSAIPPAPTEPNAPEPDNSTTYNGKAETLHKESGNSREKTRQDTARNEKPRQEMYVSPSLSLSLSLRSSEDTRARACEAKTAPENQPLSPNDDFEEDDDPDNLAPCLTPLEDSLRRAKRWGENLNAGQWRQLKDVARDLVAQYPETAKPEIAARVGEYFRTKRKESWGLTWVIAEWPDICDWAKVRHGIGKSTAPKKQFCGSCKSGWVKTDPNDDLSPMRKCECVNNERQASA